MQQEISLENFIRKEENDLVNLTVREDQILKVKYCVISYWKMEQVVDDMYDVYLKIEMAIKKHNMPDNFAKYLVCKNAQGIPIIKRIS